MRRTCYLITVAAALVATLSSAGFGQGEPPKAEDSQQEIQVGVYNSDADGNQDRVREYDGRNFNFLGLESFDTYGYNKGLQYWFGARDLIVGDEEISFGLANRNALRLSGGTNALTHRLISVPANNPWVASQLSNLVPPPAAAVQGVSWDTFKDLSPGANFAIDRRVSDLNLYGTPGSLQRLGLVAGWWQESEDGQQQLLFRAREAKAGVINNRDRGGVALPVNRETNENTVGADMAVGKNSVVNYRYVATDFKDNRSGIAAGSQLDFLPLNNITRINSHTRSQVIKGRSTITDRLEFTGAHISRQRTNARNDIPAGFANAGSILDKKVNTNSTNLALVYRATDSLSITGRWRDLGTDNFVPPIFAISGGVTQTTPTNQALSHDLKSLDLEGVYTGIPKVYLRSGYETQDVDRKTSPLHPGHEEFDHPFTSSSTDWGIWRTALRYHPIMRLNLSANYENWNGDTAGYAGTANKRTRTNLSTTYLIRDNAAIYGDYSRWSESNNQIRVPGAIPNPATNAEEASLREEAAGQGYNSQFTTATIGTWFAVNSKLTLDASLGTVNMNSGALWVIGTDPAFLPHLTPENVPFRSSDTQWSTGANYATSHRLRFYGRFLHSNSSGSSQVIPADFANLGPQWTPFSVKQNRYTLGTGYGLSKKDTVSLDYSLAQWVDKIDSGQTGQYGLWRAAWTRQF